MTARPRSISLRGLAVFWVWVMGGGSFFVHLLGPVRALNRQDYALPPPASEPRMLPAGGFVCAAYSKQRLIICGSLQKINVPLTNI